jgi:hypothetical protein
MKNSLKSLFLLLSVGVGVRCSSMHGEYRWT